ncbi:MAG: three-Cys-motif partner protein TcmP [Prevotellaceae bacterium]|nr:three-Cys-motif partner protein TcmP [Prevotellaceae bacterium]
MKKTIQKLDAKKNVLPHTQAKLDLFKGYLEHYLRVLGYADFCKQINLFDIFCGAGLYDDGKKGSPLLAIDCIRNINEEISNKGKTVKQITLTVNDFDAKKIENVKNNTNLQDIGNCSVEYCNKDANEMLDIVSNQVSQFPNSHRNLVFIDPYGYSIINKDKIIKLLSNKHTEIILFLPIMQMYRFTEIAFQDKEKPHYENLRRFIMSFFGNKNGVEITNVFEYIHSIKEALSIKHSYFTCSHYIEREKGNYYALFFIGSNIYGLEKMLETKWKLDPVKGKGFNQDKNSMQFSMFDEEMNEIDNLLEISYLEDVIYKSIKQNNRLTNIEIYELSLRNEFLPKHAKTALQNLVKNNKIQEINNSLGYKINYSNYKNKIVISKFKAL